MLGRTARTSFKECEGPDLTMSVTFEGEGKLQGQRSSALTDTGLGSRETILTLSDLLGKPGANPPASPERRKKSQGIDGGTGETTD